MPFVKYLASATGVPEPGLRLLLSLAAAYVYAVIYRALFVSKSKSLKTLSGTEVWPQHIFSFLSGLSIAYFAYGHDAFHFIGIVFVSWLLLRVLGQTGLAACAVFVWTFGYLMVSYVFYATEDYDINWTTSYCVMCLRIIGFAIDYYDGRPGNGKGKAVENGKGVWDNVSLAKLPSLLETFGYCFFFGGFLVGPQFPFAVYERFVTMENFSTAGGKVVVPPGRSSYAWKCFLSGATYLAVTQVGGAFFPTDYVLKAEYLQASFWYRFAYMIVAGRIVLTKYLGVWLLNEGSCVLSGISFNGYDKSSEKKPLWDGLTNADPKIFESLTGLSQVVISFNMNTNLWCKNYVFKRLRFLGNKNLSALGTLLFLAIWHGFQFAYFACFVTEFLDIEVERKLERWTAPIWNRLAVLKGPLHIVGRVLGFLTCHFLTHAALSYATVAFDLLSFGKIMTFWKSMYFFCHIGIVAIYLIDAMLPKAKVPKPAVKKD